MDNYIVQSHLNYQLFYVILIKLKKTNALFKFKPTWFPGFSRSLGTRLNANDTNLLIQAPIDKLNWWLFITAEVKCLFCCL